VTSRAAARRSAPSSQMTPPPPLQTMTRSAPKGAWRCRAALRRLYPAGGVVCVAFSQLHAVVPTGAVEFLPTWVLPCLCESENSALLLLLCFASASAPPHPPTHPPTCLLPSATCHLVFTLQLRCGPTGRQGRGRRCGRQAVRAPQVHGARACRSHLVREHPVPAHHGAATRVYPASHASRAVAAHNADSHRVRGR
jgi:hypothetical protein